MTDVIAARIEALCEEAEKRRRSLRHLQSSRERIDRARLINRVLRGRTLWAFRVVVLGGKRGRRRVLGIAERARERRNLRELQQINRELAAAISRLVADERAGRRILLFPQRKEPKQ